MAESFLAALRVVIPMIILMSVGWLMRVNNKITRSAMKEFDRIIFLVFMPVLLFKNIYEMDFSQGFAVKEMIFAAVSLLALFILAYFIPRIFVKDGNKSSVIAQAVGRGNYILFGVAVCEALYGEGHAAIVVMLAVLVIPAINTFAAVVLELNRSGKASPGKIFIAILRNPMIIASLLAFAFSLCRINIPVPIWSAIRSLANSTTTVSFISLGVGLEMIESKSDRMPLILGVVLRMLVVPLIFMPISIFAGFRNESLCAMMIIFAAPSAVASYPMAVAMGADGKLAGQLVCITTLLSVFTIFFWTFILRVLGLM
ncbi:MAG: AEC family transporter [Synergistaceae bacterium]|nr:AEC family transporter [Synergistaceae bacterium]